MSLSAIVLTHDNQKSLSQCLSSLKFASEIIVVDDHSQDDTLKIARQHKAKIFIRTLDDFATQRNFALKKAKGDWVLFLDSDEYLTPALQQEIKQAIKSSKTGFYLKRNDIFLGRELKHGEIGHTRLLRLARQGAGQWRRPVHEYWDVYGDTSLLRSPILHDRQFSFSQFISRLNRYTDFDTQALLEENKPFSYLDLFLKPLGKFLYNYFFLLGFLDGFAGFVMAYSMSLHSLMVRIKLYEHL